MNRLNEEKLETAPDNPSMGEINDITASTRAKTRSDTEDFRNSTERTTKVSQLIQYFIQLWQQKIYLSLSLSYTHTHTHTHTHYWLLKHKSDGNAQYSLEDSATEPFLSHWRSDKDKQSNAQWHA